MWNLKRNFTFIFLIFAIVGLLFTACAESSEETQDPSETTENNASTEGEEDQMITTENQALNELLSTEKIELTPARPTEVSEFEKFFPAEPNRQSFYEGEGGSGHRIRIGEVKKEGNATFLGGIGETKAVNPGDKNHIFYFQILMNQDGVTEKITRGHEYSPSTFDELVILKGPIQRGTSWTQKVMEAEWEVKAVIVDVRNEEAGKKIIVRYGVELFGYADNFYKEERHFVEGKGLVFYGALDSEGKIFGYELKEQNYFVSR
jgi:hypothetical protein